jgi:hypothetical protein
LVPLRGADRAIAIPGADPPPAPGLWARDIGLHRVESHGTMTRVAKEVDTVEVQPGTGLTYGWRQRTWAEGEDADPSAVRAGAAATTSLTRTGWSVAATVDVAITAGAEALQVAMELTAVHDGELVWEDRLERSIRRRWS